MQAGSITFRFLNFGYRNKPDLYTQIKAFWTINQDLIKKTCIVDFFHDFLKRASELAIKSEISKGICSNDLEF